MCCEFLRLTAVLKETPFGNDLHKRGRAGPQEREGFTRHMTSQLPARKLRFSYDRCSQRPVIVGISRETQPDVPSALSADSCFKRDPNVCRNDVLERKTHQTNEEDP